MSNRPGATGRKLPRPNRRVLVRCIGPLSLQREHYFPSTNKATDHVCPQCESIIAKMNFVDRTVHLLPRE